MTANTEVAILDRALRPEEHPLTPDVARYILSRTFSPADHERMDELAEKARAGELTGEEASELEEYRRAADLLALFHSKARKALRDHGLAA